MKQKLNGIEMDTLTPWRRFFRWRPGGKPAPPIGATTRRRTCVVTAFKVAVVALLAAAVVVLATRPTPGATLRPVPTPAAADERTGR